MAFAAEVRARLGLDTTDFQQGLTRSVADLGKTADKMGSVLEKKLGFKHAFKGLLQGIGIGGTGKIEEMITKPFEHAAESAKSIEESTAATLEIYQKIFSSRRTDEQNLAVNKREQERLQKELEEANKVRKTTSQVFNPQTGKMATIETVTKEADPVKAAEIAKQLAELAAEASVLETKIAKTKENQHDEERKYVAERIKSQAELDAIVTENARKQMTIDQQIADLQDEKARQEAVVDQMRTMNGEDDLDRKKEIAKIEGKILDLEKQKAEAAERARKAEAEKLNLIRKAGRAIDDAQRKEDEAFADRSAVSLQDAAAGKYGTTQSRRAAAKRILRMEETAKRQRATGFEAEAFETTSRAMKLRSQLGFASEQDRNPLASAADAITKSEEHLAELVESLKAEQIR